MRVKKAIATLHLALGLFIGLLVFVIAITGCLYVFKNEIQNLTQPFRFVAPQATPFLPPSQLMAIGQNVLPGKTVHAVMYGDKSHAAKVIFYQAGENEYYQYLYLNPYTGSVQGVTNELAGFFHFVLDGHFYLWLPEHIGQPVVAIATLLFFVMLLTGIVLWWPKNRAARKQRWTIKWRNMRWRRRNYDLHSVLGFYSAWIGVIFVVTGLVWGFDWFKRAYLFTASGGQTYKEYQPPPSTPSPTGISNPLDKVWYFMQAAYPTAGAIEVHPPEDARSPIAANANPDPSTYWQIDYRYFDQYSLCELEVDHPWGRLQNSSRADQLLRMNYDLHVGAIGGLPGKLLAFFASLLIASLPVTGFLIWRGRRNKKKQSPPLPAPRTADAEAAVVASGG